MQDPWESLFAAVGQASERAGESSELALRTEVGGALTEFASLPPNLASIDRMKWLLQTAAFHVNAAAMRGATVCTIADPLSTAYSHVLRAAEPTPLVSHRSQPPSGPMLASEGLPGATTADVDLTRLWVAVPLEPEREESTRHDLVEEEPPLHPLPEPPPIEINPKIAQPIARAVFYQRVVADALDWIAAQFRSYCEEPRETWRELDDLLLRALDAIACVPESAKHIGHWWRNVLADGKPGQAGALALALSRNREAEALEALAQGLEMLPSDALRSGRHAFHALLANEHPELARFVPRLSASANPVVRGIGVELGVALGMSDVAAWRAYFSDPAVAVLAAMSRAAAYLPEGDEAICTSLRTLVRFPHRDVSWPAQRELCIRGDDEVMRRLRAGELDAASMRPHHWVQVFSLCGIASDAPLLEKLLGRSKPTPKLLQAVGRYGNPMTARYLLHHLGDDDLADAADEALRMMFGELVDEDDEDGDWAAAIAEKEVNADLRLRWGREFARGVVQEQLASERATRRDIAFCMAELNKNFRVSGRLEVRRWTRRVEENLGSQT